MILPSVIGIELITGEAIAGETDGPDYYNKYELKSDSKLVRHSLEPFATYLKRHLILALSRINTWFFSFKSNFDGQSFVPNLGGIPWSDTLRQLEVFVTPGMSIQQRLWESVARKQRPSFDPYRTDRK